MAPGGQFDYTITVDNIGGGPSGSPIQVQERLESAMSYASLVNVTVNGANWTTQTTVTPGTEVELVINMVGPQLAAFAYDPESLRQLGAVAVREPGRSRRARNAIRQAATSYRRAA